MKYILLTSSVIVALSTATYAVEKESYQDSTKIEKDTDGNYNEKNKATLTDTAGTTTTSESEKNVSVDAKGNTDKTTTTKEVTDPKGMFNKKTVKTSNSEIVKDGTVKTNKSMTVNGEVVENTSKTVPQ